VLDSHSAESLWRSPVLKPLLDRAST
jgi:hypothetical protein